jgi:hypothetical protein
MGFISMTSSGNDKYIIFPIAMFIWVIYTFFDEDDKEYKRRHGIKSNSWFGWDDYGEYGYYGADGNYYNGRGYHSSHNAPTRNSKPVTPKIIGVSEPEYKRIVKRCRKSVNITIDKVNPKEEEKK